jgi:signal peptidase I
MTDDSTREEQGPADTEQPTPPEQETPPSPESVHGEPQSRRQRNGHEPREGKPGVWRGVREALIIVLIAAVVAVFVQSFLIKTFIIPTSSMSPTLQIGDRIMAERVTYYFRKPRRGDIVVFRYPPTDPKALNTSNILYWPFERMAETFHLAHGGTTPYVKRVIATEGETIEIKEGQVIVDGKKLDEDYKVQDSYNMPPTKVPSGELFVMGDNRPNSRDSRYWGTAPVRSVIGRVFLIWWPLRHFGVPAK